jgi:hypothetical protein
MRIWRYLVAGSVLAAFVTSVLGASPVGARFSASFRGRGTARTHHHSRGHRRARRHRRHKRRSRRTGERNGSGPVSSPGTSQSPGGTAIQGPPGSSDATTSEPVRVGPIPVDGPVCVAFEISVPCNCPQTAPPDGLSPPENLPSGDGWVDITIEYGYPASAASCPGGIVINHTWGSFVTSAGYVTSPADTPGPGIPAGAVTQFVLPSGPWQAVADAGRTRTATATFDVTAGHQTDITITIS